MRAARPPTGPGMKPGLVRRAHMAEAPFASGMALIALAGALLVTVVFVALALLLEQGELMRRLPAAFLVLLVAGWQVAARRPRPLLLVAMIEAVIIVQAAVVANASLAASAVGLVVVAITGATVVKRVAPYLAGQATVGLVAQLVWHRGEPLTNQLVDAVTVTTAVVFGSWLVLWMRHEARAGEGRYRSLFENAPVPLWEIDLTRVVRAIDELGAAGVTDLRSHLDAHPGEMHRMVGLVTICEVNDAALDFLSARREAVVGPVDASLSPTGFGVGLIEHFAAVPTRGFPLRVAISGEVKGRPYEAVVTSAVPAHNGKPDYSRVTTTLVDVTAARQAARRLEQLLQSKDELIAAVSHELRTPLAAVYGLASEMRDRLGELAPGEVVELAGIVADQSEELAGIVDDLLVAARHRAGHISVEARRIDLGAEVRAVAATLLPGITVEGAAAGPDCWADPGRVRQVVRNLVVNAQRYGGPAVRIVLGDDGGHACVEIRDDGPELPATAAEHMFEPFYTRSGPERPQASVGLGLTISRRLARHMGGDLTYRREAGESVFALSLPAAAESASPVAHGVIQVPSSPRRAAGTASTLVISPGRPSASA